MINIPVDLGIWLIIYIQELNPDFSSFTNSGVATPSRLSGAKISEVSLGPESCAVAISWIACRLALLRATSAPLVPKASKMLLPRCCRIRTSAADWALMFHATLPWLHDPLLLLVSSHRIAIHVHSFRHQTRPCSSHPPDHCRCHVSPIPHRLQSRRRGFWSDERD